MQLLREHISAAGGAGSSIDVTTSNQIYGLANDAVLEMIEELDPGVPLTIKPLRLAGFTRSAASEAESPA